MNSSSSCCASHDGADASCSPTCGPAVPGTPGPEQAEPPPDTVAAASAATVAATARGGVLAIGLQPGVGLKAAGAAGPSRPLPPQRSTLVACQAPAGWGSRSSAAAALGGAGLGWPPADAQAKAKGDSSSPSRRRRPS